MFWQGIQVYDLSLIIIIIIIEEYALALPIIYAPVFSPPVPMPLIIPESYHAKTLKKTTTPWYILLHNFTTRPSFKNLKNLNVIKKNNTKGAVINYHHRGGATNEW